MSYNSAMDEFKLAHLQATAGEQWESAGVENYGEVRSLGRVAGRYMEDDGRAVSSFSILTFHLDH